MKKVKPKWNFQAVIDAPIVEDVTLQEIVKKSEIAFTDQYLQQLKLALIEYLGNLKTLDRRPRISQIKAALSSIKDISKQFTEAITALDSSTRSILRKQSEWVDLQGALNAAQHIHYASVDALTNLPADKGGPSPQIALEIFIKRAADIFQQQTGENPTLRYFDGNFYGPFFVFVELCLVEIKCAPHSNQALGSSIKRALKKKK